MLVYKYISFENLLTIIETKKMFLRNISKWEDPFEGFTPLEKEANDYKELLMGLMNGKFKDKSVRNEFEQKENIIYSKVYEKFCFAQSWSHNSKESDAMWRIYSSGKGVRIAVDVNEIISLISKELTVKNILETNVHSMEIDYSEDTPPLIINSTNYSDSKTIFKQVAGYKRKAFSHEDEYRIGFLYPIFDSPEAKKIFKRCNELRSKNNISDYLTSLLEKLELLHLESTINFFNYHIDLSSIKEIILDPRAKDHHTKMVFQYIKNRKLNIRYYKSGLYNRGI